MYFTLTINQFFSLFLMVLVAFSMSYAFAVMNIYHNKYSTQLLISAILSEISAGISLYFSFQLTKQNTSNEVQWLSIPDIFCFIVTLILFTAILHLGPSLWQKHYLCKVKTS